MTFVRTVNLVMILMTLIASQFFMVWVLTTVKYVIKLEGTLWPMYMVFVYVDVDNDYVEGISITRNMPHQHIWTFATGNSEDNTY